MSAASLSPDNFYQPFVELVRKSFQAATNEQEVQQLLNGAAADEVHSKIPRAVRSKDGIFFSGHALSQETAELAQDLIKKGAKIFDPACGAGDLLLAAAKFLPLQKNLKKTLETWGQLIGGTDLHQSFVETTKWRLALLAKNRHGIEGPLPNINIAEMFLNIKKFDYLSNPSVSNDYDCILVNPPFGHRKIPEDCDWSSGRTQLAAIFIDQILKHRTEGQIVIAILPDVLRGGTRYKKWRQTMENKATTAFTKVYGRFEKRTDVDVFIARYECGNKIEKPNTTQRHTTAPHVSKVEDLFSVKVGSVVPHRSKGTEGPWRPYLKVGNAPANQETEVQSNRRYNGSCFEPPFVAIRRTSNPSDKQRIIYTLVIGDRAVAVENHLIVISPKSKSIQDCRLLAKMLIGEDVTRHINEQLRCRHLTTGALKSVPLPNWED